MPDLVVVETPDQFVAVSDPDTSVVISGEVSTVVVQEVATQIVEVVAVGPQAGVDLSGVFQVINRFYEIAEDETAKAAARTNLGLATIDGGTFN